MPGEESRLVAVSDSVLVRYDYATGTAGPAVDRAHRRDGGARGQDAHRSRARSLVVDAPKRQQRLGLERRRVGVGRAQSRKQARDVRRREAVAGRHDRTAAAPGHRHVDAPGPELDRRVGVVEVGRRVRDVVRRDRERPTRTATDSSPRPGTLLAEQTSRQLAKYAWSTRSWNVPNSASLRDDRLRFATAIRCSRRPSRGRARRRVPCPCCPGRAPGSRRCRPPARARG